MLSIRIASEELVVTEMRYVTGSDDVRFPDLHTPSSGFGNFLRALHNARDEVELAAARAAFDQVPAI